MIKKNICIVIPIYKEVLNDFEVQSVAQCIKVLSDYTICFVCPKGLNIVFYKTKFDEIEQYVYFDSYYFENLKGYNQLMLSVHFYKSFKKFDYILIYQTDCFVFRDELLEWSKKEYDYIGGVWFDNYDGNPYLGAKMWHAGNGGFSLRKIESMIRVLSSRLPLRDLNQLIVEKNQLKRGEIIKLIYWFLILPFKLLGYKNNFNYYAQNYSQNEDNFFMEACLFYNAIKTPDVKECIGFSWDRNPEYLFGILGNAPFACHAWFREKGHYVGNRKFWLNKIEIKNMEQ